ncbi:MAG: NADH-quinone oxidoreductase subunit L, partial [Burkholderiales bacterium]|nr:NADH-quinone oxidoreductase subunit L [Burkholderiales bacterium]
EKDRKGLPPHSGGIEPMYARFFAFISLFAFGMLTLVVTDNLLVLFVGWEIMGLCSYLLIGFWYGKDSAKAAMVKAFMTTRVGDVFMLLGLAYLYSLTGTLNYSEILFNHETLDHLAHTPSVLGEGTSAAALIVLLLFIGTVGKSAQWPLHTWLPDAMEGPTPVSAMIHAAAMVSAGIYLILRIFPLITAGWHHGDPLSDVMVIIAFIGAFTALFAATLAVGQNDIKRVLAFSTISQLGFMVSAVGLGAFVAAAFHLVTHAFFKALLFLGSGSVIHGVEHGAHETHDHVDPNDMRNM